MRSESRKFRFPMPEFEILLKDVMIYARHGVLPEERITGNQYRVNVTLRIDASWFDPSLDDLSSTISYANVYDLLKSVMSKPRALLESVAVNFASQAKDRWANVKSGEIEIIKTVPPIEGMIGEAGIKYCF